MNTRKTTSKISKPDVAVVLTIAALGFTQPAFAYLDPSTGSMILSAILGIFASLGLALKTYWYRIKNFFGGSKAEPEVKPQEAQQEAADEAEK